jgi:hypothetical protein
MFCATEHVLGGAVGVGSSFHVLRSRTHFRRHRELRVPFSCFSLADSFSSVPGARYPIFMFYATRLIFGGTECFWSRFHVLRARTRFRRYRGRRVRFSCFALRDTFSAVPKASSPFFMFCVPGLVFGGTEGVRSRFHVLRSQTCFRRCGGRRFLFSCFVLPN